MEAFHKVLSQIQLWKDEFESRAPNNIETTKCSRSIFGYRVNGDEERVEAHDPEIDSTRKIKQHVGTEANVVIIRRKATICNKILGEMKARADDVRYELEAYQAKGYNHNPEDYSVGAI